MKKLFAAALAAIIVAPASQAITLQYLGLGDHAIVNIKASSDSGFKSVYSGELIFKDTTNTFNGGASFLAYCLDPGETLTSPMPVTQTTISGPVGWLVQTFGVNRTGITIGPNTYSANVDAAGFQLAIWKFMDPGLLIGGSTPATIVTVANHYYALATSQSDTAIKFDYVPTTGSQDLVTENFGGTSIPVPEPFTMAIGAAGLATALVRRRRKV
ncbi:MAG: PEP-CTERM sorting domain-containing protein [Fimbriimonadales bacterium]|nr:PEP-CTERM sorting domain-containing protein [Fimbriimonadales bacterium]